MALIMVSNAEVPNNRAVTESNISAQVVQNWLWNISVQSVQQCQACELRISCVVSLPKQIYCQLQTHG